MRGRRLAYPAARLVGGAARLEPLAVAGTVPCEHGVKLVPVDRTDEVMLRAPAPAQRRIGIVSPRNCACGTVMSMNFWRSSSLLKRLIFQRIDCAVCFESASLGPNIMIDGHHQRSSASCAMARCASLPCASVSMISKPWR